MNTDHANGKNTDSRNWSADEIKPVALDTTVDEI
jgi:hypothetical protein